MSYSRSQAIFLIDCLLREHDGPFVSQVDNNCRIRAIAILDSAMYGTVEHKFRNGDKLIVRYVPSLYPDPKWEYEVVHERGITNGFYHNAIDKQINKPKLLLLI